MSEIREVLEVCLEEITGAVSETVRLKSEIQTLRNKICSLIDENEKLKQELESFLPRSVTPGKYELKKEAL